MLTSLPDIIASVFCWAVKRAKSLVGGALAVCMSVGVCATVEGGRSGVLVLGDSLSAGYGIELAEGWVHLLAQRIGDRGDDRPVVNASISGETTRGGLDRLSSELASHTPGVVIVELGGNDGLRGLPLAETHKNLRAIVTQSRRAGARVLLIGMALPPNYGPAYTTRFKAIYVDLAAEFDLALVPFLLEGVALVPALMQEDGIHPRAQAQPMLLDTVWPHLEPLLE